MSIMQRLWPSSRGQAVGFSAFGGGARWVATHCHRKGGLYRKIGVAVLEADRSNVVIYDDETGTVWVRPVSEFDDGRFTPV